MLRNRGDMMFSGHIKSGANLVGLFIWIQITRKIQNVISSKFQKSLKMGSVLYSVQYSIEEVWKQKPRQTVVGVLWGKIATHMASIKTV